MKESQIKHVKRFFKKLLYLLVLLCVVDWSLGRVLEYSYFRQVSGSAARTNYAVNKTEADVIIFGTSRAAYGYDPQVIENELGLTCYNAGKEGNSILFNYAIFKALINRHNPKLILFDLEPLELTYEPVKYDRLSVLLPFYRTNSQIREIINLRGPFEKVRNISSIYPYNSLILQMAIGNIKNNHFQEKDYNGYVPLNRIMPESKMDSILIQKRPKDSLLVRALEDVISTCKEKDIDLIFIYSPIYRVIEDTIFNPIIVELCLKYETPYFNFSNDPLFVNNPQYFADWQHLNDEGAGIFSKTVADTVSKLVILNKDIP